MSDSAKPSGHLRGRGSILHVSTVHTPFDSRIFERQCRSLAAVGYEVRFLVPHSRTEIRDGVEILPLESYKSRLARLALGGPAVLRACLRENADITCVHDPELIPLALLLKLLGRRACYDAHEDYVAYFRGHPRLPRGVRSMLAAAMLPLEALAGRFLDFIVAATPAIARRFGSRRCHIVQNFPPVPALAPGRSFGERATRIAYIGELNEERGARELLDALERLQAHLPCKLAFAGRIRPASLRDELEQHPAWPQVEDHGWLSAAEVRALLETCRVGVVPFKPIPNHLESQPRKLFEYMAAGLPIVASDFPLWKRFVEDASAGITTEIAAQPLAEALAELLSDPQRSEALGRAGHRHAEAEFSWQQEEATLLSAYREALG